MRHKMPTLGPQPRNSPLPKVILVALVVGGVAGGIYWLRKGTDVDPADEPVAKVADVNAPAAPVPTPVEEKREPTVEEVRTQQGISYVSAVINGPLETAIVAEAGGVIGPALTQVVTRSLVWWVQIPGELRRGDRLEILYEGRTNEEPLVHAVRFHSSSTGKVHSAWRFKAQSESNPRMYEVDGRELEERLRPTPIDDYEQITSLLRDGRRHSGVDFKAAVGTPVRATFDGTITRKNWNFRYNGNALEIVENSGRRKAVYLHLDVLDDTARAGMKVKAGQIIAKSGNTGRSFAPHLHYQLQLTANDKVLDPFTQHDTWRKSLPEADRSAFDQERARLEALMVANPTAPTSAAAP